MMHALANFHFLRPWWLAALVPVIGVWLMLRRSQDPLRRYRAVIAPHLLKHLVIPAEKGGRLGPGTLLLAAMLLAVIALAGPAWQRKPSPFAEQQAGLAVLIRMNPTMKATDLKPSRLVRAQHKLHDLLQLMPGSPVSLIVYSGSAHMVMPFTRDARIVEQMAAALSPEIMPVNGDVLAQALALATAQFERAKIGGSILVITDGISGGQLTELRKYRQEGNLGLQILGVVAGRKTTQQTGLANGAATLGAPLEIVTVDSADVQAIQRRSKKKIASVFATRAGNQWRDEGYWLLPFVTLLALAWTRKGWSIQWS